MNEKDKYVHVCRMILIKCEAAARKNIDPVVSFDDLKLPFQDYHCLDMREKGWLVFGVDADGKPGVSLARHLRGLERGELMTWLNEHMSKNSGRMV